MTQFEMAHGRVDAGVDLVATVQGELCLQVAVAGEFCAGSAVQAGFQGAELRLHTADAGKRGVDNVAYQVRRRVVQRLGKIAHAPVDADAARVGLFAAGQQPQHGGFARAVFTHQSHAFTVRDHQVNTLQQKLVAISVRHVGERKMLGQELPRSCRKGTGGAPRDCTSGLAQRRRE